MTAADLFSDDLIQVFSRKYGTWIGTVSKGSETNIEDQEEINDTKIETNPNQLNLF